MGPERDDLIPELRSDLFRGLSLPSCSFTECCGMRHVTVSSECPN